MDFNDLIKDFISIFWGIIIAMILSQECLLQPSIVKIN
jgi:hypothetical protein